MSGTTMSTPSSSDSGNISPASMTKMSSPQRTAMQFIPNSPRPPSGTICSLPLGMEKVDASTALLGRPLCGKGFETCRGRQVAFPARDDRGGQAIADHVDAGAAHVHELINSQQEK